MNIPRRSTFTAVLLAATFALSAAAEHAPRKLSLDVLKSMGQESVPVIIQYNFPPAERQVGHIVQNGGAPGHVFATVPAIAATLPGGALGLLSSDPEVKYVALDRSVGSRAAWYSAEPVNAPAVWKSGFTGEGIGIAVIDSGVDAGNPDLAAKKSRVVFSHNFLADQKGNTIPKTQDQYGHGTHVAGIIAGDGSHSTGNNYFRTFKGIAPGANIVDLQVLDQYGRGNDSNVIAAIEMAIALKNTYNIRVINLSLGRPVYESYRQDPLCQAVEQAWKAGILVVVAGGNDGRLETFNPEGYGTINSPGNDPFVLTVGATNTNGTASIADDTVASYSSKGPTLVDNFAKPDLMAPGSQIASLRTPPAYLSKDNPSLVTLHSDYMVKADSAPSPDYFPLSGTSMASAVVSGAGALLFQANPQLTPDQVKALFMRDATKGVFPLSSSVMDSTGTYTAYNDLFTVGAGYLNIAASLEDAQKHPASLPAGNAMSPIASLDPSTNAISLKFDWNSLWSYDSTWVPGAVYGSQAFDYSVDGSTVIWGRSALTGSTVIWGRSGDEGSTVIWGRSGDEGSTVIWGRSGPSASSALLLY